MKMINCMDDDPNQYTNHRSGWVKILGSSRISRESKHFFVQGLPHL